MKHTHTKTKMRRPLFTALVMLILAGAGVAVFAYVSSREDDRLREVSEQQRINLEPATEEEKKDSEQRKEADIEPTPSTPGQKTNVTPAIVDASQYSDSIEVRSYVPGILEDDGTCTITFTHGSTQVTKQVSGQRDANYTRCTNIAVDRSEFTQTGEWSVVVSYSSPTAQGSSQPRTFEVK